MRTYPEELINKSLDNQFKDMLGEKLRETTIKITSYLVDEAVDLFKAKTASEKKRSTGGMRFMIAVIDDVITDGKCQIMYLPVYTYL